jgi:predicted ArsR family transcriptional regulator
MKPPVTVSPEEAVPRPTVPANVRKRLLAAAKDGVTTVDAAEQVGLPARTVLRYMDLLRVEGAVHLQATEDGRGAEWKTGRPRRSV